MDKEKALLQARATLKQFFEVVQSYRRSHVNQTWREYLHISVPDAVDLADALCEGIEGIDCAIREAREAATLSARLKKLLHTTQETLREAGWALEELGEALEELPRPEAESNDNSTPTE